MIYPKIYIGISCNHSPRHSPKIHGSALRKITIYLLYFWDVYEVNLWEKKFGRSTGLFVCLFVFPVNKIQISYTESCNITMIKILGKELAADLKVLSPSPWNYNVVLTAVSQRCFQTQSPKKSRTKQKKKGPAMECKKLKDHWPWT